jgi:branched-chain amino acid transport system substrate-binding protein
MKKAGTTTDAKAIMSHMDEGIKAVPKEKVAWHISGLANNGFNWKGASAVVENGKVVLITK